MKEGGTPPKRENRTLEDMQAELQDCLDDADKEIPVDLLSPFQRELNYRKKIEPALVFENGQRTVIPQEDQKGFDPLDKLLQDCIAKLNS